MPLHLATVLCSHFSEHCSVLQARCPLPLPRSHVTRFFRPCLRGVRTSTRKQSALPATLPSSAQSSIVMLPPNHHVILSSDLFSLYCVLCRHDVARRHGVTPLQIACGFGSPRVAQQLINAGAALLPIRWAKIVEKPAIVQVSHMFFRHERTPSHRAHRNRSFCSTLALSSRTLHGHSPSRREIPRPPLSHVSVIHVFCSHSFISQHQHTVVPCLPVSCLCSRCGGASAHRGGCRCELEKLWPRH